MRYKSSLLALLIGLGMYGFAPVITHFAFGGATPAYADDNGGGGDGGHGGGGHDGDGHDGNDDHGNDHGGDDDDDDSSNDDADDDHGGAGSGDDASAVGHDTTCKTLRCVFSKS